MIVSGVYSLQYMAIVQRILQDRASAEDTGINCS